MRTTIVLFLFLFVFQTIRSVAPAAGASDSTLAAKPADSPAPADSNVSLCSFTPAPEINALRLSFIGGVLLTTGYIIDYQQRNAWWLGQRGPFHIENDWLYALNVDKVGHIYGTALTQHVFQKSFEWSGLSESKSIWYGAGLALSFELYIEVQDGFHKKWGFSPGDALGDAAGAFFPVLQYYVPPLRKVNFRWSYWPSADLRSGKKQMIIDDYQGQTYWLSILFYDWLPESWQSYWPSFLGIAVGYAVRDLDGNGGGEKEYFIALEYDLTKLPGDSWILRTLKQTGNFFHLPSPAIRLTPKAAFFGLYF